MVDIKGRCSRPVHLYHQKQILDVFVQIFNACCISATHISAPKGLAVVVNTKKTVNYKLEQHSGVETHVGELQQV